MYKVVIHDTDKDVLDLMITALKLPVLFIIFQTLQEKISGPPHPIRYYDIGMEDVEIVNMYGSSLSNQSIKTSEPD